MHDSPFKVVIPARYASSRLPGKPLLLIAGQPMLQHVYQRALASGAEDVIIATDDERIRAAAAGFGADVCMTSVDHASGTERIAEVAASRGWAADSVVVNLQGDEPLVPPSLVRQVASDLHACADAVVATLASPLEDPVAANDPNVVKVVLDRAGYALYFSRAAIPCKRDDSSATDGTGLRHIGLYAYRAGFLAQYSSLDMSPLEDIEKLEQLRVLWHGLKIHVALASEVPGPGIDTRDDLERVTALLESAQ